MEQNFCYLRCDTVGFNMNVQMDEKHNKQIGSEFKNASHKQNLKSNSGWWCDL